MLDTEGFHLEVQIAGEGPRKVVLLHPWLFDSTMWSQVVPLLANAGYQVTTVDLPGHGTSGCPSKSYGLYGAAMWTIEALRRAACRQASIVGVGMGAMIAMRMALLDRNMVNSLVLIGASAEAERTHRRDLFMGSAKCVQEAWRLEDLKRLEIVRSILPFFLAAETMIEAVMSWVREIPTDQVLEAWQNYLLKVLSTEDSCEGLYLAARAFFGRKVISPEVLRDIQVPVLIARGASDVFYTPGESQFLADYLPGAGGWVLNLPGAGHLCPAEDPKQVAGAIGAFLTWTNPWSRKCSGGCSGCSKE